MIQAAVLLLYALLVTLLTPLLPLLYLHPRLRAGFLERMGMGRLEVEPGGVWVHAASVGEGRIAANLIQGLRAWGPISVLRTCTSASARGVDIGADQQVMLPFDLPLLMLGMLDRARPRLVVLVEGELWPGLIWACRRRGVPVAVVGARAGPGLERLRWLPIWGELRRAVTWMPVDVAAAVLVGGEPTGDLKAPLLEEVARPPFRWEGAAVIGACTYAAEEQALLTAVSLLSPRPLLILAPRQPDRFDAVWAWLERAGARAERRSRMGAEVPEGTAVVLLDSMGELARLYPAASAALIGGTFDARIGGHSPAEAAAAGCPVLHGPETRNNAAAFDSLDTRLILDMEELSGALSEVLAAGRPIRPGGGARARVELVSERIWRLMRPDTPPERALRPWLWPLAPLWMLAVMLRPRGGRRARVPVISVGGLTAGGSGKTPVAAWLAAQLQAAGQQPAVAARGYGRRSGSDVRERGESVDLGDELTMLARRGHRVASCPDRVAGVEAAVRSGATVAILDDGLQYGAIHRDLEIIVIDGRWPGGGGPIPVGWRRVPLGWLGQADVVWVNHGSFPAEWRPLLKPGAAVVEARYVPTGWLRRGKLLPLDALPRRPVVAMAGIARPEGFFRMLRSLGVQPVRQWIRADHEPYAWGDIQSIEAWIDDHVVLTTEKDAARLPSQLGVYALQVELEIVSGEAALREKIGSIRYGGAP